MSEEFSDPADAAPAEPLKRPGERLAKAIARAGLGSRRDAEVWIEAGRVKVNGETVTSPNLNVEPGDAVEVDGKPLPARERTRLWLYHKPRGYVTTTHDPEGRETVFSILPQGLPRVMTVGRLDINTEGLLLLTNDGGLARVLELPETGWLRRYRVRAFGRANPASLEALRDGVEIDGFAYGAIEAEIERQQSDNVWLRFGLREGKNREVKRVAEHLGLAVNRLIRISFGPFQLGALPEGGVEEVRTRTLQDQLGRRLAAEAGCDFEGPATSFGEDAPRMTGGRGGTRAPTERSRLADPSKRVGRRAPIVRPREMAAPAEGATEAGERPAKTKRAAPIADRKGRSVKVEKVSRDQADAPAKRVHRRAEGTAERFGAAGRTARPARPARDDARSGRRDARPTRGDRDEGRDRGSRPPSARQGEAGDRPRRAPGDRPRAPRVERSDDARSSRPRSGAPRDAEPRWSDRPAGGERPDRRDRPAGAERPRPGPRRDAGGPGGDRRSASGPRDGARARPLRQDAGDRPTGEGRRPGGRGASGGGRGSRTGEGRAPTGERPRGPGKPGGSKPRGPGGGRPGGGKPRGPGGPRGGGGRPGGADRRR